MRGSAICRGVACWALACLALIGVARADNRAAARDAYREGSRLYDLTDYKGALESFKKAYVNYEEPTLLFNIAQCHRYLGQKTEAITFYKTYLRKAPTAPNADEVRRLIAQLETAQEQERRTKSAPPAGTLGPEAKKPEPAKGKGTRPAVTAVKTAPPPPATPAPPEPAVAPPAPEVATTPPPPAPEGSERPLLQQWWLWTAVGGGVVIIALAVGLGVGLSQGDAPYPATHAATVFRF